MDEAIARDIARQSHDGQLTRHGSPMTDHVERVAAAVPDDARVVALLHDVLEKTGTRLDELDRRGLSPNERAALDLLTRRDAETFERHTLRIGDGDGPAGAIARRVKLADLEDHIGLTRDARHGPPYRWARRHVLASQHRRRERAGDEMRPLTLRRTQNFGGGRAQMSDNAETAILAGGCFWGVQELLRRRDGIISTRVGYTGGENDHPTYPNHPGHAEAVEIVFDPERISYRDILELLFQIHDPTTKDRQGNDIGSAYRSEIFYTSDEQRQVAEETIADVDASGLWPGKVVTEISEAVPFWEAEPEHQDYLQRYPDGYTCHYPRPGWKLPHRETAA